MSELGRDHRGPETGNAARRAAEQWRRIAKAQQRSGVVVVKTAKK